MNDKSSPSSPAFAGEQLDEQLVAYLDGELSDEQVRYVERLLAEDPNCRLRLQQLRQTWELLDFLPSGSVGQSFAQTTVEMVALQAQKSATSLRARWRRTNWLFYSAAAAALLAVGLTAYLLTQRVLSAPNRELARDLPVIENLDLYHHVDGIEFLRQLHASGLFSDETAQMEASHVR